MLFILFISCLSICILYTLNIIPHLKYSNKDFNITRYISKIDKDNDGVDDVTDILKNTKAYLATNPEYKSKYYSTGYPNDKYGVCTDVVGFALLNAGYDLRELVNEDIINNRDNYNIEVIDKNIDFRRVNNLNVYFKNNSLNLTLDVKDIDKWQAGDIVVFKRHIGILSEHRNSKGIPFVYHHNRVNQKNYEEDIIRENVIGHYRIS